MIMILSGPAEGISRMPLGGPYISDTDLAFIAQWITDGAPDADPAVMTAYGDQQ
jgi:hypothetical protein